MDRSRKPLVKISFLFCYFLYLLITNCEAPFTYSFSGRIIFHFNSLEEDKSGAIASSFVTFFCSSNKNNRNVSTVFRVNKWLCAHDDATVWNQMMWNRKTDKIEWKWREEFRNNLRGEFCEILLFLKREISYLHRNNSISTTSYSNSLLSKLPSGLDRSNDITILSNIVPVRHLF